MGCARRSQRASGQNAEVRERLAARKDISTPVRQPAPTVKVYYWRAFSGKKVGSRSK
jgi:hypothetical protein